MRSIDPGRMRGALLVRPQPRGRIPQHLQIQDQVGEIYRSRREALVHQRLEESQPGMGGHGKHIPSCLTSLSSSGSLSMRCAWLRASNDFLGEEEEHVVEVVEVWSQGQVLGQGQGQCESVGPGLGSVCKCGARARFRARASVKVWALSQVQRLMQVGLLMMLGPPAPRPLPQTTIPPTPTFTASDNYPPHPFTFTTTGKHAVVQVSEVDPMFPTHPHIHTPCVLSRVLVGVHQDRQLTEGT